MERAFEEGGPRRWVTGGDSACAASRTPRRWLEEKRQSFVLAVPSGMSLWATPPVAGVRQRIKEGVEQAKDVCGLDEQEVRKYRAWRRHIALSLLDHAFLAVVVASKQKEGNPKAVLPEKSPRPKRSS